MPRAMATLLPGSRLWRTPVARGVTGVCLGLAAFLVIGNLLILGASLVARAAVATDRVAAVEGIDKLRAVDEQVWRGARPHRAGYRALADAGVTVSVDLRAEDDAAEDDAYIESLGIRVVHVPIRDGQTPSSEDVERFLAAVRGSDGRVFVHCGAGVGRAGAMVAAYLRATDQAGAGSRVGRNLAVGPPSFEQIVYAAKGGDQPSLVVKALSRTLDAPRRIWHTLSL